MRYRLVGPSDLIAIRDMLRAELGSQRMIPADVIDLWQALLKADQIRISVVEDPELPREVAIQAVGLSVFVGDDFAEEFVSNPRPGLAPEVYRSIVAGNSPILSKLQVGKANAGGGLNLVMLHFLLRNPDLMDPHVQQLMGAVNAAFIFMYSGYRLRGILQEVYDRQAADYMCAGGFRLLGAFSRSNAAEHCSQSHPPSYLLGMSASEVLPAAINPLSLLFNPVLPRIYFSPAEQIVIERALLNQTDREISEGLAISLDAVKKTWRRIFDRTGRALPFLVDEEDPRASFAHNPAKRRRLLEYVRLHLEELRPYPRPRS